MVLGVSAALGLLFPLPLTVPDSKEWNEILKLFPLLV